MAIANKAIASLVAEGYRFLIKLCLFEKTSKFETEIPGLEYYHIDMKKGGEFEIPGLEYPTTFFLLIDDKLPNKPNANFRIYVWGVACKVSRNLDYLCKLVIRKILV